MNNKFENLNVIVIGDVMLDIFTYGTSNRISPEAPVPVVKITNKDFYCGGAGNVAYNLRRLNVNNVYLFGVIGYDNWGTELCSTFDRHNIKSFLFKDNKRPTTIKERFIINNQQQMLRVDTESVESIDKNVEFNFLYTIQTLVKNNKIDVIILSDYNKGVLSEQFVQQIIDYSNENNIITAIDPKPNNLNNINGATLIKLNLNEACELTGKHFKTYQVPKGFKDKQIFDIAQSVRKKYNSKYLVISLSADGVAVCNEDQLTIIPTTAKEVFDVSGAGDVMLASITCALASGYSIEKSAEIGNIAAGIAVGKRGTSIVYYKDIVDAI